MSLLRVLDNAVLCLRESVLSGFCFDRLIARVFRFGREVQFFVRQIASGFGSNGEVSGVSAGKVRVLPYCRG